MIGVLRFLIVLTAAALASAGSAAEIVLDSPMLNDPALELPGTVKTLSPKLKALWFQALDGPESGLKMRAAEAIARAKNHGLNDMSDAASPLVRVLDELGQSLPVRLSAARALIVIDARQTAVALHEQARRDEIEMRQLVEPALAEWDYEPIRAEWLERLNGDDTPYQLRLLAVRCLGVVREPAAAERLQILAGSAETPPGLRIEAARALAEIASDGLEEAAEKLASDESAARIVDRLVAASMLKQHRGERAISLLKDLALDPEPAVAAIALRWLLDADPALVIPFAEQVVRNRDANVRRLGAQALAAVPSPSAVETLGPLLDDPHPEVRAYVRDSLYRLAETPELDGPVREATTRVLAGDGWRGLEQAAMLLGALDHEPAANRLLELLEHPRAEVIVASAWALRRLALPETLAPMLELAERQTARVKSGEGFGGADEQLSQIFQAFGQMKFRPADALLREYVPKSESLGINSRAAAIWALGHLHAGELDPTLVAQFQERLADILSIPPESDEVRRMAAVSLGRMGAEEALPTLREFYAPDGAVSYVTAACNWAITQLTGEEFPKAKDNLYTESGWFLEPIE